jgi:hypothetical protein
MMSPRPSTESVTWWRTRQAAHAPNDPDRLARDIEFMAEQLDEPAPEPSVEAWHKLYHALSAYTHHDTDFGLTVDRAYPEIARVRVWSSGVVETFTMDAAACMYGATRPEGAPHLPWCGGRSRTLYDTYGHDGLRRFNVLPSGPDDYVEIDGERVPVASDAYTIAVDPTGNIRNINDYQNRYPGQGLDTEGAKKSLRILSEVLPALRLNIPEEEISEWEGFKGDVESWADAGFNRKDADKWLSMMRDSDRYGEATEAECNAEGKSVAATAAEWREFANGDVKYAAWWNQTFLEPDEAEWLEEAGLKPEQVQAFLDDNEEAWPDGWDLEVPLKVIFYGSKYGLKLSDLGEAKPLYVDDADNVETYSVLGRMKARGLTLPVPDYILEWVLEDKKKTPEGKSVADPKRRIDWLAKNPPDHDLYFFVDNPWTFPEWKLAPGESPGGVLSLLRKLTGAGPDDDLADEDLEPYKGMSQRELAELVKAQARPTAP